jgi:hypothetical protein
MYYVLLNYYVGTGFKPVPTMLYCTRNFNVANEKTRKYPPPVPLQRGRIVCPPLEGDKEEGLGLFGCFVGKYVAAIGSLI